MIKVVKRVISTESGATVFEYALVASLIAIFVITAWQSAGSKAGVLSDILH